MMIKGKILSTSTKDITHVRILIKFNKNENIKQEHGDINSFGETIIIIVVAVEMIMKLLKKGTKVSSLNFVLSCDSLRQIIYFK